MTLRAFIEDILDRILNAIRALHIEITNNTLTGSIVSFVSKYAGLPLKSHKIALTATQSGSGTPSPDNVRPISGYSAINISHSDADTSNPTVYTIQIGSTVYGGEYDARTGVLTVTHVSIDLGSVTWIRGTNPYKTYFRTNSEIPLCKPAESRYRTYGLTCSIYLEGTWSKVLDSNGHDNQFALGWENKAHIGIYDSSKSEMTAAEFKTAMNGVQLMYPLATPTTIQLSPCPIDTLQGLNNIWADTGETTIVTIEPKIKEGN